MKRTLHRKKNERVLWGVQHNFDWGWALLFGSWHEAMSTRRQYEGEPSRPVLFRTRQQARDWCAEQHRKYRAYKGDGVCEFWRFRAVRITETLKAR